MTYLAHLWLLSRRPAGRQRAPGNARQFRARAFRPGEQTGLSLWPGEMIAHCEMIVPDIGTRGDDQRKRNAAPSVPAPYGAPQCAAGTFANAIVARGNVAPTNPLAVIATSVTTSYANPSEAKTVGDVATSVVPATPGGRAVPS